MVRSYTAKGFGAAALALLKAMTLYWRIVLAVPSVQGARYDSAFVSQILEVDVQSRTVVITAGEIWVLAQEQ